MVRGYSDNPMKTIILSITSAAVALGLSSCEAPNGPNTQQGAVIGGLSGAALGGIIGHQSGRGLEGAAIGGALGAGTGAVIGNKKDQQNYEYDRYGYRYDKYGNRYDRYGNRYDKYGNRY
jgi:uncharacterized protein YcfJ